MISTSPTRILVAEDEHVVALDLQSSLESLGYAVVATTPSGEEAVRLAERTAPDVVLMDIHLQGTVDGIEASRRIRSHHKGPIIYLTANSDSETLQRVKLTEPFGYILKPFEIQELRTAIEMSIQKHALEKKFVECERKFRKLADRLSQTVFEMDLKGNLTFLNRNGLRSFGYTEQEFDQGLNIFRLIGPAEWEQEHDRFEMLRRGEEWSGEYMMIRKDGTQFRAALNLSAIDRDGEVIGASGIVADVSHHRESHAARERSQHGVDLQS